MPELPEVEIIRSYLEPVLSGQALRKLELRREDIVSTWPKELPAHVIQGKELTTIDRKGKYLLFNFADEFTLLIHLRMTGKLLFLPSLPEEEQLQVMENKHTHALLHFPAGILAFNDVRRFGRLEIIQSDHSPTLPGGFLTLGPDAVGDEFTWQDLRDFAKHHSRISVKALLLDQRAVAGVGNIYADETLFRSAILPHRLAGEISDAEWQMVYQELRNVLFSSINAGGTSFRDYRNAGNREGTFKQFLQVYGRSGLPCVNCGSLLQTIKIAGRSTVFCPVCQK